MLNRFQLNKESKHVIVEMIEFGMRQYSFIIGEYTLHFQISVENNPQIG